MPAQDAEHAAAPVLIIDESEDCREVLRTMLAVRGVSTIEACEARQGLALLNRHRPSVVVLDLDVQAADDERVRQQYAADSLENDSALVILGRARSFPALAEGQVISKPYHFAPLLRTIEQLLVRAGADRGD